MCRAIEAAHAVDEVKDIRDKAKAWEEYSRQAKNVDAERRACDIRLRAERKAGQILRNMEKAKGGKPNRRGDRSGNKTLKQLGVSKDQSKRWQKLAEVPADVFETALCIDRKPTTNGVIARIVKDRKKPMDEKALWVWGRVLDFERNGTLADDPRRIWMEMAQHMRKDYRRLVPLIIKWLEGCND